MVYGAERVKDLTSRVFQVPTLRIPVQLSLRRGRRETDLYCDERAVPPTMTYTLKRIRNIYSQNPNSTTLLPNTKFIFLKQIFIILCCPSLPMRPKARVLALISVMPKLISAVYQQLDCQMHTAEQLQPGQSA
jgi:hypothetical protein